MFGVGVGGRDSPFDSKICLVFDYEDDFEAHDWHDYYDLLTSLDDSHENL